MSRRVPDQGAQSPCSDDGLIELDGEEVSFAIQMTIVGGNCGDLPEFNLVPELSAAENIFLGIEPNDWIVKRRQQFQKAREILSDFEQKLTQIENANY